MNPERTIGADPKCICCSTEAAWVWHAPADCPWPHIAGKPLTDGDLGRVVTYTSNCGTRHDHGKLSSYREDGAIFVRFKGPQGERCESKNLSWGLL